MDARLIPTNAFIALASRRTTSWPNTLFEIGYALEGLEVPASAGGGRVVIDCVAFDATSNRFLLGESKAGNNIKPEQARRYRELAPRDLVRLIGVTITTPGDLRADPIYICLADKAERVLLGLERAECTYPVLAVGDREISLRGATPSDPALAEAFATPVPVDGPPPGMILVDGESPDVDFDGLVAAALIAEAARGSELISCPDLAARSIPYLHLFGDRARNTLVKAVAGAAQRLCVTTSETFEYRPATETRRYAVVKVLDSPERADPRGRTQRYQAIKARMRGLPPDEGREAVQGALFDEVDLAAELDKADTGEPDDEGEGG